MKLTLILTILIVIATHDLFGMEGYGKIYRAEIETLIVYSTKVDNSQTMICTKDKINNTFESYIRAGELCSISSNSEEDFNNLELQYILQEENEAKQS